MKEKQVLAYCRPARDGAGPASWARGLSRAWLGCALVVWAALIVVHIWPGADLSTSVNWVLWVCNGIAFPAGYCVTLILAPRMTDADMAMVLLSSSLCGVTALVLPVVFSRV